MCWVPQRVGGGLCRWNLYVPLVIYINKNNIKLFVINFMNITSSDS